MKNYISLMLLLSFLCTSCGNSGGSSNEEGALDTQSVTGEWHSDIEVLPGLDSDIPDLALTWDTNVYLYDFTTAQAEKYNKAVEMVKKVVATERFRDSVLNHYWNGSRKFSSTTKTNQEVYQSILDAAEKLTPSKNNVMDVGVKLYYENSSVVGWTNGSITYFNVNTKFFNGYGIHQVAGNLFHEWLHKLGYGHDSAATAQRPYSVPYAVGYMIRDIGQKFL